MMGMNGVQVLRIFCIHLKAVSHYFNFKGFINGFFLRLQGNLYGATSHLQPRIKEPGLTIKNEMSIEASNAPALRLPSRRLPGT